MSAVHRPRCIAAGTKCQAVGMDHCAVFFGVGRLIKFGLLTLFKLFSGATMPTHFSFLNILRMPHNAYGRRRHGTAPGAVSSAPDS